MLYRSRVNKKCMVCIHQTTLLDPQCVDIIFTNIFTMPIYTLLKSVQDKLFIYHRNIIISMSHSFITDVDLSNYCTNDFSPIAQILKFLHLVTLNLGYVRLTFELCSFSPYKSLQHTSLKESCEYSPTNDCSWCHSDPTSGDANLSVCFAHADVDCRTSGQTRVAWEKIERYLKIIV